jgi:hypothetical protein
MLASMADSPFRVDIDRAARMVAAQALCSYNAARELMRVHFQKTGLTLDQVAQAVIDGTLNFSDARSVQTSHAATPDPRR